MPLLAINHPNRLCAAANLLLKAIRSPHGFNTHIDMHAGPSRVGAWLPPRVFTPDELIEAMAMLVRLGLVQSDRSEHLTSIPSGSPLF